MSASPVPIEIRVARPADVPDAGDVVANAYQADLSVSDSYLEELRDAAGRAAQALLLVAVDGDTVVGSITYARSGTPLAQRAWPDEAELRMLGVAPEARGRGIAEALVRACLEQARADGATGVVLSTQTQMAAAQRLYERLGFQRRVEGDWVPEPGVFLLAYRRAL